MEYKLEHESSIREQVEALKKEGRRKEAISLLETFVSKEIDEELLLLLGELLYGEGKMTEAMNRFNAVLRVNPANRKAMNYVAMIKSILDYYNKDLLNP